MFLNFVVGGFSPPKGFSGLCSQGWVEESHMVCDAYLFILKIHASRFGAGGQEEMAPLFSVCHITGRLSMGQGSRISEIDSD
jgi:hypothetical protein